MLDGNDILVVDQDALKSAFEHRLLYADAYRDLFITRRMMMDPALAAIYRVPITPGPDGWGPYEFPAGDPRVGILTQAGFLSEYAHPGRSSSTKRGRAIREVLLCQKVPDPPPNVDFSIVEDPNAHFHTARTHVLVVAQLRHDARFPEGQHPGQRVLQ